MEIICGEAGSGKTTDVIKRMSLEKDSYLIVFGDSLVKYFEKDHEHLKGRFINMNNLERLKGKNVSKIYIDDLETFLKCQTDIIHTAEIIPVIQTDKITIHSRSNFVRD